VVENHLLGFTDAEDQFASYKGGYLWCAYLLPMSVHHFCGLLVKDIIFFNEIQYIFPNDLKVNCYLKYTLNAVLVYVKED